MGVCVHEQVLRVCMMCEHVVRVCVVCGHVVRVCVVCGHVVRVCMLAHMRSNGTCKCLILCAGKCV